ncbi:hypothetical protein [Planomonospora parontospora]|nr:hypothetical protein [Planomonospora parontospora]
MASRGAEPWRLSDQERIELVRKLNLPQKEQGPLSWREHEELDLLPFIRPPAQVEAIEREAREELTTYVSNPDMVDYRQGILDAIAWARGERAQAPVSGQVARFQPPTYNELVNEVSFIDDVSYRRVRLARPPSSFYSSGVGQTLLWLVGYLDDPPTR